MEKKTDKQKNVDIDHNDDYTESVIRFDQLSWKQIAGLDASKTIFFLPISPLEEHGPHLPVGTDFITAQDTSIAAIKKLQKNYPSYTYVLLPAIPLGFADFNTDFPGTVSVSSRVVKQVVYQYGKMLANSGFQHFMICTYHMALVHLKGIYAAMNKLRRKYDMNVCEPWSPRFHSDTIAEQEPVVDFDTHTEVHAGFRETSLMTYSHPALVDDSFKKLPLVYTEKVMSPAIIFNSFKKLGVTDGYIGTPAKANASYGKWFFHFTVHAYSDAAEKMIKNEPLPDLPKKIKRRMNLLFWL